MHRFSEIILSRFFLNLRQNSSPASNCTNEQTETCPHNSDSGEIGLRGGTLIFARNQSSGGDGEQGLDEEEVADEEGGNEGMQYAISEEARASMQLVDTITA